MRNVLAAALVLLPSLAVASPSITAGVNLGLAQSKLDGDQGADATRTLGLYGRLGFSSRISGQVEVSRIDTDDYSYNNIRKGTALLVVDLGSKGNLVPVLMAGFGLDSESGDYGYSRTAHHIEGGLGLEYRAPNGLTIGADARLGGRTIHQEDYAYPTTGGGLEGRTMPGTIAYYTPSSLQEGEYRAARITVGIRF